MIAGGGAIGTAIAYYLVTAHNVRVTLVDPCALPVGDVPFHPPAASGHAGGFLATWAGDPLTMHGFALHAELGALLKDTEYRRLDTLSVSVSAPLKDASSSGGGGGKPPKRQRCSQDTRAKSNLLENCRVTFSIGDVRITQRK